MPTNTPEAFVPDLMRASKQFELDPRLIESMMSTESSFNPMARSGANARGLMQLMPATAKMYGVTDPHDPQQNIMAGSAYLRSLLNRFQNLEQALAAYNAGPTAVRRAKGVPAIPETQNYVKKVMQGETYDAKPYRK